MTVVAAATSVHLGLYFDLLGEKECSQDNKLPKFIQIINKCRETSNYDDEILEEAEWLMHSRNAVAHPEEWIITESTYVPNKFDYGWYKAILKIKVDTIKSKAQVHGASNTNDLRILRNIATDSINKAENIISKILGMVEQGNVEDWKKEIERQLGNNINLEKLS
jgi:hypothetical protein